MQASFNGITAKGGGGGAPLGSVIIWTEANNPEDMENWHDCDGGDITGSQLCTERSICVAPNFQGMFLRGLGGKSLALGVEQADSVGPHSHYMYYGGYPYRAGTVANGHGLLKDRGGAQGYTGTKGDEIGDETRPVNKAVRYLIRINE